MLQDPWLLALAAAFCFGAALVLTQRGLAYLTPAQGAAVSVPCSALLLWLVVPFRLDLGGVDARGFAVFAAVGLLFPAAVTLLTFDANRRMGPHVAGALGNLAPLFAVAAAAVMLGEAPQPRQLLGLGVIVAGVVLLSLGRGARSRAWPLWVLALPLAAAAIRGLIQPGTKLGLGYWPSPFAAVLVGYTVSAAVILGSARLRGVPFPAPRNRPGLAWFALVGLGNASAVLLMYAALALGPVALVSPLVATYPLVTLALSPLLLGRVEIGRRIVIGVAATVGGVILLLAR
ncbi:DMT family transporter [Desertibaculum subflavum]|uniref:DMT family transporter n=1 Tax=Desertibaculum subflavum TaxID=2268458 RepID=UPI0013C4EEDA